jgi:hypothetical protein
MLPTGNLRIWQPFTMTQQSWTDPTAPKKKGLPTTSPAHRLTDPWVPISSFSPLTTIETIDIVMHLLTKMLHQFTGPISPACDQYIQYLVAGANPSVLNRHRRGYKLGCVSFSHHSPHPSQPMVIRFFLIASSDLQLKSS